jgi:NADH:ubiquinone oxidoreductase subunit K
MFTSINLSLLFFVFIVNYSLFFFSIFFFISVFLLLYVRNDNFLIVSIGLEVLYIVLAIFFCSHSILLDDLFYFWLSFCCIVLGAIDTAIALSLFSSLKKYSYFLMTSKVNSYKVSPLKNKSFDSSFVLKEKSDFYLDDLDKCLYALPLPSIVLRYLGKFDRFHSLRKRKRK